MGNFAEDRENELIALKSIYEDRLQIIDSVGLQKFAVTIEGNLGANISVTNSCQIFFEYTEEYPNAAPKFQIQYPKNLSDEEVSILESIIDGVIDRSLGYIMIFDVLSDVQEKLNSLCEKRLLLQQKVEKDKKRQAELEAEAKFQGDRVTIESFLEWNIKFLAEMSEPNNKKTLEEQSVKRLTGRELFLRDNRYDNSDLTFLEDEGGEVVEIDETLFTDIGDIELDDDLEDRDAIAV